jgi:hypothetical protein
MKCRWNRTILNLCGIMAAILKMATGKNFQCRDSFRDIIIYQYIKLLWYQTMLNICGIVAAILKMAIGIIFSCRESIRNIIIYPHIKCWWYLKMLKFCGRNFSMSGINSGKEGE